MPILVTGGSGLLGREVMQIRKDILGTAYSRVGNGLVKLDLTQPSSLEAFFVKHQPQVVIHCAAERRPDVVMKDEAAALELNVGACRELARLSKKLGFYLIYISSDYVFDGTHPPYEPTDATNPLNFYGKTKLMGEQVIFEQVNAFVLRVPLLYGLVDKNSECSVTSLIDAVLQGKTSLMDHFCSRFPTHVRDVAKVLDQVVDRFEKGQPLYGIYHFSAKERLTKYEMCQIFCKAFGKPLLVQPLEEEDKNAASRPKDAQLSTLSLEKVGIHVDCIGFEAWFTENASSYLFPL